MRRAVIDIGTNSVKLLVADAAGRGAEPVLERSKQTRLGAGFFGTRRLLAAPVADTAKAVGEFVAEARISGAEHIRIIATSAARDAVNPEILIEAVESASGLKLEIISGDREAEWAFQGVATNARFGEMPLLILDVGGGSTEFILGEGGTIRFQRSYQLGTVRALESLRPSEPPTADELRKAREWAANFLKERVVGESGLMAKPNSAGGATSSSPILIGTGGTATLLAKMQLRMEDFDRAAIENAVMTRNDIQARTELLWSLPLEARQKVPGLPANRADVILTGAVIFEAVMRVFDFEVLHASTRGLRFGALL